MKIFLGNAPWHSGDKIGVRAGSRWPHFQPRGRDGIRPDYLPFPFFIAYAAAVLEREGFAVMARDAVASGDNIKTFVRSAKEFEPQIILLETSTPTIQIDLEVVRLMKAEMPSAMFAFAGPHAPMFDTSFLEENTCVDFVLYGEYELTLLELVKKRNAGQELDGVRGLIFRKNSDVYKNSPRPLLKDLDTLPYPARHLLPIMHYNDSVCNLPRPNLQMWASRGCPYQCNFCAWPQIMYSGSEYRTRDPREVVREVDDAVKKYGFKGVYFDDDTFNLQKNRVLRLCDEIVKKDLHKRVAWAVMARADAMDEELLTTFKNSGLYAVKYGVETGSQALLDGMGKKLDLDVVEWVVRRTKELGIRVHLTFSFGHQGETHESIKKTVETALLWEPDAVQFSIITPFPGSRYYDVLNREGRLLAKNWEDFNGSHKAVFYTENLSAKDLEDARDNAYKRWEIEMEQKNNRALKENLRSWLKNSEGQYEKILIIRSSFLAHTKNVVDTIKASLPNISLDMLVQKRVVKDIEKWKSLENIYSYDGDDFDAEKLDSLIVSQVSGSVLVMILCNNPDGTGYENVYNTARLFGGEIVAINPAGRIFSMDNIFND